MNIKAVVFDYGKVICFPPEDSTGAELAAIAQVEQEKLDAMRWKYRDDYDRGLIDGIEYYGRILKKLGKAADAERDKKLDEIDGDSWKRINPGTVKLMEDVKKAGCLLGILSNMPFGFLEWARKSLPVFSLPHAGIFSCEAGFIKPEKAIYKKLLSELKCCGEEVVFFDDIPINVEKARELGINAFLWEDPEKARLELNGLGVKLC